MKTRSGFVSNSSSSSFVVALPPKKTKIQIEVDLSKHADHVLTTEEEALKYFRDDCCYGEDSKQILLALSAIRAGKHVLVGAFSSEDEGIAQGLCYRGLKQEDNPDMIIIWSEGGY